MEHNYTKSCKINGAANDTEDTVLYYVCVRVYVGQWFILVNIYGGSEGPAGAEVKDTRS